MKPSSILEKFNVKPRKNAKSECYCIFDQREMAILTQIWTSSSVYAGFDTCRVRYFRVRYMFPTA